MGHPKAGYHYNILGNSNHAKSNNKRPRKINN